MVPGGDLCALSQSGDARYYLLEAYKHLKPILLAGDARQLTSVLQVPAQGEEGGHRHRCSRHASGGHTARPDDGASRVVEKSKNRRYSGVVKSPAHGAGLDPLPFPPSGLHVAVGSQTITPVGYRRFQRGRRQHIKLTQPRVAVGAAHNGLIDKSRMTHHLQGTLPAGD